MAVAELPLIAGLPAAAQLAEAAYFAWDEHRSTLAKWGFTDIHQFDSAGTQAFIARHPDGVVVYSFAGTNEWVDWLRDLHALPRKLPKVWLVYSHIGMQRCRLFGRDSTRRVRVHAGFLNALMPVAGEMLDRLRNIYQSGDIVMGTHHSLGTGPGSYFASEFVSRLDGLSMERHVAYLWGAPRLGNRAWSTYYNRTIPNTLRIVNNNDMVTRVPPSLAGYSHVGGQLYFDWRGRLHHDAGCLRRGWNQLAGRAAALRHCNWIDGISDHLMHTGYLPTIRRTFGESEFLQ